MELKPELSAFQIECLELLHQTVQDMGAGIDKHSIESATFDQGPENVLHGRISKAGLEFWIYEDEAMFSVGERRRHFERPDFRDRSELMRAFVEHVARELSGA